jgi:predicted nucleotidyltransferase component of viral defense system
MLYKQTVAPETFQVLETLCSIKELSDFSLAGGTALALQIGHRISVDLDFFGRCDFETQLILDLLESFKPKIISQNKNILILNIQDIKVDFVNYRYPLLSEAITEGTIRLLAKEDIAAMKLAAIAGRGRKRDFYDLYYLLKYFSLHEMISFYNAKYQDGSELMVARSLTYFDDADLDEAPRLLAQSTSWNLVKERISNEVKLLYK